MAGTEDHPDVRAELPAGTLTFVLTDIEGSTALWDDAPAAMAEAQRMHDALIASVVESAGGRLVKSKGEGDSTFSVFVDATAAVLAAEKIRDAISATAWPTPTPVRVRIGVSTGVAEMRDGDYYGAAVVRAARVRGLAHGDEVLLAASTYSLIADSLLRDRVIEDRGEQELRGLQRPERVYALQEGEHVVARVAARRTRVPLLVGAAVTLVVVGLGGWLVFGGDADDAADVATTTVTTVPLPVVNIASIETTNMDFSVVYDLTGSATRVNIPPYQIRVLARDPLSTDTWLWSYPAKVDANGAWKGKLEVPTVEGEAPRLKLSAIVILPPEGDTSPTGPSELPLTGPGTEFEEALRSQGPETAGIVAVSDATP